MTAGCVCVACMCRDYNRSHCDTKWIQKKKKNLLGCYSFFPTNTLIFWWCVACMHVSDSIVIVCKEVLHVDHSSFIVFNERPGLMGFFYIVNE